MAASTAPALPEQAGLTSLPSSPPRIDVRGDSPAADQPRIRRSITLDSTPAKQKMAKAQLRVRHHTWIMAAAERACAGANWSLLRRPRQPKARGNVAAVASAQIFHVMGLGTGCRSVNAPPILSQRHLA